MRKLLVLWLVVLAAPAAALAAADATGDGSLAVTRASGTIFVQGRGVIYGHFDSGTLMVLDYRPDDLTSVPAVSSGKSKYSGSSGVYTGTDVRFLLPSGRYTIELIGVRIDASAVGPGERRRDRSRHLRRRELRRERRQAPAADAPRRQRHVRVHAAVPFRNEQGARATSPQPEPEPDSESSPGPADGGRGSHDPGRRGRELDRVLRRRSISGTPATRSGRRRPGPRRSARRARTRRR